MAASADRRSARVSGSNVSASASDRNSLSSRPSGSPAAARVLSGSAGANSASSAAISALGKVTIAASAAIVPRASRRECAGRMVDAGDGAVQGDVEARAEGGDRRAVAFDDAPVDAVLGVAAEVARRNARRARAAVITADCVERRVPSPARFDEAGQRAIGLVFRQRVGAFVQRP